MAQNEYWALIKEGWCASSVSKLFFTEEEAKLNMEKEFKTLLSEIKKNYPDLMDSGEMELITNISQTKASVHVAFNDPEEDYIIAFRIQRVPAPEPVLSPSITLSVPVHIEATIWYNVDIETDYDKYESDPDYRDFIDAKAKEKADELMQEEDDFNSKLENIEWEAHTPVYFQTNNLKKGGEIK